MARGGKRPVRGGKRKSGRQDERRPKPKKAKFSLRNASYVKERDAKNEEIERYRRMRDEEKAQQKVLESESSEEEQVDPMQTLLSTFAGNGLRKTAVVSSSEDESSEDDEQDNKVDSNKKEQSSDRAEDEEPDDDKEETEIIVRTKEEDAEDPETAQEDAGNVRDPFSIHLHDDLDDKLYEAVSSVPQILETEKLSWPVLGNLVCQIPKCENSGENRKNETAILDKQRFAKPADLPERIESVDWTKLYVKPQIHPNLSNANSENLEINSGKSVGLTPLQRELFSVINNYQDLYYPQRSVDNANEIRFIYCLHAINHILKTRTKILHHNAKIGKSKSANMADLPDEYRDQGLVRPKVLIVVPFRHSCLKIVETLIAILIGEDKGGSVVNKTRFMTDFSGHELGMPKKNPKPEDYEQTFQGNTDDTFKIGLSITKKTLKLYTEFYSSDIIISSVLGLRMLVGAEGEEERDYDFLASIELLVLDQTELFLMQNWDHLIHVLSHLHLQPKESHGTDFSRVRSWCANGWTKYYRQTLIFSSIQVPEIHGIFTKKCYNYAGKVKVANPITAGSICQVITQVPQVFHKFESSSHSQALAGRLEFFIEKILPQYKDKIMNHTLIYVPSYFEFVKLRNYFKKEELSFVQICEYSKDAKVARARDMFFHSDAHFLLYSERFHFFRRIRMKGIRHLIFYGPPTFPHFYSEMCNLMQEANQNPRAGSDSNMTVSVLYCKYDMMQLSAIVGTERASKMLSSEKSVHMLMTGDR